MPQRPVNPYGETKLAIERALHWYGVAYGLRSVALRYFNAAGADPDGEIGEEHDPETHLIPLVLRRGARPARARSTSSAPTIRRRTAPRSATTSMSTDLAERACPRAATISPAAATSVALNLGTGQRPFGARGHRRGRASQRPARVPAPRGAAPRRATRRRWSPIPALAQRRCSAGGAQSPTSTTIIRTALAWETRQHNAAAPAAITTLRGNSAVRCHCAAAESATAHHRPLCDRRQRCGAAGGLPCQMVAGSSMSAVLETVIAPRSSRPPASIPAPIRVARQVLLRRRADKALRQGRDLRPVRAGQPRRAIPRDATSSTAISR